MGRLPDNNLEIYADFAACIDACAARTGCRSVDYNADTRECYYMRGNYVRCASPGRGLLQRAAPTRRFIHTWTNLYLKLQVPKISAANSLIYCNARIDTPQKEPVSAPAPAPSSGSVTQGGSGGDQAGGGGSNQILMIDPLKQQGYG